MKLMQGLVDSICGVFIMEKYSKAFLHNNNTDDYATLYFEIGNPVYFLKVQINLKRAL